jgi:uncharacterized membrane protein
MNSAIFTISTGTDSLHQNIDQRIQSVDFLRGLVVVLMAIDHVRVYSGLPPGGPEAGIFLTRWITHFCAPVFAFLTGTSAYLYGLKLNDSGKLARYLFTRGALLILLEFTVIRFAWTFNLNFNQFILAGVIWMLGACMMLMAALIYLRPLTVGLIGLGIILFQNVFGLVPLLLPESSRPGFGKFWEFVYSSGLKAPEGITILYVLIPWIGVMAAGYGFGIILKKDPAQRRKLLLTIGGVTTLLFVIISIIVIAVQPAQPNDPPFIFQMLNQRKYPASQLFLMMTLGPAILLMPFVERAQDNFSKALITFGRVPFFYYLMHIFVIHISALIVNLIREGRTFAEWYATAPYVWFPEEGHQWSLALLYLVFFIDIVILYFLCRWYEHYKFSHPDKLLLKYV